MEIIANQHDSVDAICWRVYGRTLGVVEAVLAANPNLAQLGPILPIGTKVVLPINVPPPIIATINLWN